MESLIKELAIMFFSYFAVVETARIVFSAIIIIHRTLKQELPEVEINLNFLNALKIAFYLLSLHIFVNY